MGEEEATFGAIVLAGVTMLIGTKLLVGAMIELLSQSGGATGLLLDSVIATTIMGVVLLLATGGLLARGAWSRYLGIVALAAVAVLGRPSVSTLEPIAIGQTTIAVISMLYLVFRNPVAKTERSNVDEDASAARIGSTIR